jgi:hypothetical protein
MTVLPWPRLNRKFGAMEPKAKSCGGCDVCCRLYEIDELEKPAGTLCAHACGSGCGVYAYRPAACRAFDCLWLMRPELDALWRPDHAGFVLRLGDEGSTLWIDVDPLRPEDWRREPYYGQIKAWSAAVQHRRGLVMVAAADGVVVVFPEDDIFVPHPPQGARVEAGYRRTAQGRTPWVRVVAAEDEAAA